MRPLTELEGAVLIEVSKRKDATAFQVRRAFQTSRSSAWSGSAGAVYPAIHRLIEADCLAASKSMDGRGTQRLSITALGARAYRDWMRDGSAALGLGADPFRLRAPMWLELPKRERLALFAKLEVELKADLQELRSFQKSNQDKYDAVGAELAVELAQLRLAWIRKQHAAD